MPGIRRARPENDTESSDSVHPSRKRRIDDGEANARLAQIYNDLADEIPSVRLSGAGDLCKYLATESFDQVQRVDNSLDRLIRGLCSGRKAARLGFSVALSEVLRLAFGLVDTDCADCFTLADVTDKVVRLTRPEGKASRQEQKEHLLGRRFAFQAILRSDVALRKQVSEKHWRDLIQAVINLAGHKDWLRTECGAMLYEYLKSVEGTRMGSSRVGVLLEILRQANMLKTTEGVALWLAINDRWPEALPKSVWAKKNPMSADEQPRLKKILLGSSDQGEGDTGNEDRLKSGSRQSQPNFVWSAVLGWLYHRNVSHEFERFWREVVERGLLHASASTERKALGLQVVALAVSGALPSYLNIVLDESVVRMLVVHRAESGRYLFDAAKHVFDSIITRAKAEPEVAPRLMHALLAEGAFDQQTKTKTIDTIVQRADEEALDGIVATFRMVILRPRTESEGQVDARRRACADVLLSLIKTHRSNQLSDRRLAPWFKQVLQLFVDLGYRDIVTTPSPTVSEATRAVFRSRLTSCVSLAVNQPPALVAAIFFCTLDILRASWKNLNEPLSKRAKEALKTAEQARNDIAEKTVSSRAPNVTVAPAFDMLFGLSMFQVYNGESDGVEALEDLQTSFSAWQAGTESSMGVIELLLSFLSKPSAALRKLAEQAFTILAANVTAEALQSLLDILQQKESLSGQQELFEQEDEDAEMANGDSDAQDENEDGVVDVEDDSNLELVNGEEAEVSDDGEDDDGNSSSDAEEGAEEESDEDDGSDEDEEAGEDEEAVFDRKLADALGTAGMDEVDSDDDGSDMDDEQMLALEPHLATIFKERKKIASKKQDNKDAKETIINFKNRVLDLLGIYVKSQHANLLALDVIIPLTTLVRTTSSKPTAEKAFAVLRQYFEACSKNKSLPQLEDDEACFEALSAVHEEMKLGGSKLHASACSRSSLFLSKVLVATDLRNYKRIAKLYSSLQTEWYLDPKSKVQGSIFTEWTSWSLATRKQI